MDEQPDLRLLFRFRDLVAETLSEHRKKIVPYGSCWWGWWKRPNEDQHMDVWKDLENSASSARPVQIGLFHTGSGEVYLATVIGVIPPSSTGQQVSVPEEEIDLVPEYYQKSPFSRAWLRLSLISERPLEFFGNYSYESIPRIPNYAEATLRSFERKVIVKPDELRGMDTTIWRVRKREAGDSEREILLSVRSVGKPISREPIEARSNVIVHLSDPHFAVDKNRDIHVWRLEGEKDYGRSTLSEALRDAVGERKIGAVIVTGDFTFTGIEKEYEEAETFLRRLSGFWNLDMDRFVIIPGNHDIQWTRPDTYDPQAKVDLAPEKAQENYRSFYRRLYGHDLTSVLAMGRRFALPCGLLLEVCGVNSSSLEQGHHFLAGMGRVQENSFSHVINELGWNEASSLSLRVLALHHHLALTEDLEEVSGYYHGFGIAIDAPAIQRMAARHGVHLALHGHKHRMFVWRSGVYELPEHTQTSWSLGNLSIIGGGSAGSRETEGHRNYFNVIEVSSRGVRLDVFRAPAGGAFRPMQTWLADFSLADEPHRLVLGEWKLLSASA